MTRYPSRPLRPLAAALALLLLPACGGKPEGPPLYQVRGQVFVGGKPAEKADVYFHPLGNSDPRAPGRTAGSMRPGPSASARGGPTTERRPGSTP